MRGIDFGSRSSERVHDEQFRSRCRSTEPEIEINAV